MYTLPHITYASRQQYTCLECGLCCHRFHVQLTPEEKQRLDAELHSTECFTEQIKDNIYFRRGQGLRCVFLDEHNHCRIHSQLGGGAKALSCRGYPLSVAPTFAGEASACLRMDCPAVLANHGIPLNQQPAMVEGLIRELHIPCNGYTNQQVNELEKSTLLEICRQMQKLLYPETYSMYQTMGVLMLFARHAKQLGATFLNDHEVMREIYPTYGQKLLQELPEQSKYELTALHRVMFKRLVLTYCRRDEEIPMPTFSARMRQAWNIAKLLFNHGSLHSLGQEHPDTPLVALPRLGFTPNIPEECWINYRRFIFTKLESLQFFGASFYDVDFFTGLKALFVTFPVAISLAYAHAAVQDRNVATQDVDYAVAAIDHCFGCSPALRSTLGYQMTLADHFSSLVVLQ